MALLNVEMQIVFHIPSKSQEGVKLIDILFGNSSNCEERQCKHKYPSEGGCT